ncbi:hypothetical protein ACWEQL_28680 [Kitasatospora sp. NPDC004240]
MNAVDEQGMTGEERAAVRALGVLASEERFGPAPYERLLTGGRRRLRRRRLAVGAAVAAVVTVTAGTVAVVGPGRDGGGARVAAATAPAATPSVTESAGATASAQPARDPLRPVKVLVARGESGGTAWQAWAELWPRPDGPQQALAQEAAIGTGPGPLATLPPQERYERLYPPGLELVRVYLTVDGQGVTGGSGHRVPVPGGPPPAPTGQESLSGSLEGAKGGAGAPRVLMAPVGPDVVRAVATWADGTTTEAPAVVLGDSPMRWIGVPAKPGTTATSVKLYGADGTVLLTDTRWLR